MLFVERLLSLFINLWMTNVAFWFLCCAVPYILWSILGARSEDY